MKRYMCRSLGEELLKARKQLGITQANAAKYISIGGLTLGRIERGKSRITEEGIQRLCSLYEIDYADLMTRCGFRGAAVNPVTVGVDDRNSVLNSIKKQLATVKERAWEDFYKPLEEEFKREKRAIFESLFSGAYTSDHNEERSDSIAEEITHNTGDIEQEVEDLTMIHDSIEFSAKLFNRCGNFYVEKYNAQGGFFKEEITVDITTHKDNVSDVERFKNANRDTFGDVSIFTYDNRIRLRSSKKAAARTIFDRLRMHLTEEKIRDYYLAYNKVYSFTNEDTKV